MASEFALHACAELLSFHDMTGNGRTAVARQPEHRCVLSSKKIPGQKKNLEGVWIFHFDTKYTNSDREESLS